MWLFGSDWMVSMVECRSDPDSLLVRARVRGDVDRFAAAGGFRVTVEETPHADYRFRALLPRNAVADMLLAQLNELRYPNFKNSVPDEDRLAWYSRVWTLGLMEQDRRAGYSDYRYTWWAEPL